MVWHPPIFLPATQSQTRRTRATVGIGANLQQQKAQADLASAWALEGRRWYAIVVCSGILIGTNSSWSWSEDS